MKIINTFIIKVSFETMDLGGNAYDFLYETENGWFHHRNGSNNYLANSEVVKVTKEEAFKMIASSK